MVHEGHEEHEERNEEEGLEMSGLSDAERETVFERLEARVREAGVAFEDGFQLGDVLPMVKVLAMAIEECAAEVQVGDKKELLLDTFDYLDGKFGLRQAIADRLSRVPGISAESARAMFDQLLGVLVDGVVAVLNEVGVFEHRRESNAARIERIDTQRDKEVPR